MQPSSNRALHAVLSGWLVGLLAVGPVATAQQSSLPARLMPRALPAASGQAVTVVAIALDAGARSEAVRLANLAEQAVTRSGRLELVRLADALDTAGRQEREARDSEAAAAMKEGQRAYDELDTQQALQQFDKAVRAYEASDLSLRFGELSHARVMRAASQVANGESTAAQLEIRLLLAVNPRAQFSPNFFPPDEMAFVEKERKAVLAASRAPLTVRTEPVPAEVFVDGQFRGVSPVTLTDLPPADHYVTVVAPGYALAQRRAREGDTSLTLKPLPAQSGLQRATEAVARKPEGEERDRALRELGTLAGVPQVLALLVRSGAGALPLEVRALRLDVADGHNLAYALGTVPSGEGMAAGSEELLTGLVAADAPRQGGKPVTHFAATSTTRRTAGYVLLATGAALVAGGIYFGLEASSKEGDFKRAPQNSPRAQDLKDTGKTYALVADVGIIAGLVSAGLGGYFAFLDGRGKTPARVRPTASSPPERASPQDPKRGALPTPPSPARPPPATPPASKTEGPSPTRAPDSKRTREDEARQRREEAERQRRELEAQRKKEAEEEAKREQEAKRKREEETKRKRDEEEAKRKRDEEEAKRKRDEEAKRKREEEGRRREEEEKKKKRPALDEDDLRNY